MLKLLTGLKLISEDNESQWELPEKTLNYELIEWRVMEKCLGRMDILNEKYNCFKKSDDIFDQGSCNDNGETFRKIL